MELPTAAVVVVAAVNQPVVAQTLAVRAGLVL
jgi:hypothetical protein